MLIDCSLQQIRLAAQRHEHLIQMPCAARLAPRRFGALGESSAELVSPATDRLVRDLDATLKQQLLDVAHAQTEPEIPANRATDDDGREAVTVIKRFRFLHHFILLLCISTQAGNRSTKTLTKKLSSAIRAQSQSTCEPFFEKV